MHTYRFWHLVPKSLRDLPVHPLPNKWFVHSFIVFVLMCFLLKHLCFETCHAAVLPFDVLFYENIRGTAALPGVFSFKNVTFCSTTGQHFYIECSATGIYVSTSSPFIFLFSQCETEEKSFFFAFRKSGFSRAVPFFLDH